MNATRIDELGRFCNTSTLTINQIQNRAVSVPKLCHFNIVLLLNVFMNIPKLVVWKRNAWNNRFFFYQHRASLLN